MARLVPARHSFLVGDVLTITLLLHMIRVAFTGSYKAPREVNWYVGVGLLLMMVGLLFTGTVLKWDQEAYEALAHFLWVAEVMGVLRRAAHRTICAGRAVVEPHLHVAHLPASPAHDSVDRPAPVLHQVS